MADYVFTDIYVPAASGNRNEYVRTISPLDISLGMQLSIRYTTGVFCSLKVVGDLRLKNWADVQLPLRSLEVSNHYYSTVQYNVMLYVRPFFNLLGLQIASDTLKQKFQAVATRSKTEKDHDDIFDHFKQTVVEETFKVHQWDSVAREALVSFCCS